MCYNAINPSSQLVVIFERLYEILNRQVVLFFCSVVITPVNRWLRFEDLINLHNNLK